MSTASINFAFNDLARIAQKESKDRDAITVTDCRQKPTLRLALVDCEHLRFPNSAEWMLRILSGKAWVTFGGQDFFLENGDNLVVPRVKNDAIISAMGKEALLFEIT